MARPRTPLGFSKPGRDAPPEWVRGAPPPSFRKLLARPSGRRMLSLAGILGVLLMVGVSGARVVREDGGHPDAVRSRGPVDSREIRRTVKPGSEHMWSGRLSPGPHGSRASHVVRGYTITADRPVHGELGIAPRKRPEPAV